MHSALAGLLSPAKNPYTGQGPEDALTLQEKLDHLKDQVQHAFRDWEEVRVHSACHGFVIDSAQDEQERLELGKPIDWDGNMKWVSLAQQRGLPWKRVRGHVRS